MPEENSLPETPPEGPGADDAADAPNAPNTLNAPDMSGAETTDAPHIAGASPKTTPPPSGPEPEKPFCHYTSRNIFCKIYGPFRYTASSFIENKCLSMASSLSYTTVLSFVPFLAVAFSITKGLGMYNGPKVRELLLEVAAGRQEVVDGILEYIGNTNVQALGVIGTALLLLTAVSLIGTIESAFNAIWKVKKKRAFLTKFTNYLTLIFVCPVLVFTAMSATATAESNAAVQWMLSISIVSHIYAFILGVLPYIVVWAAFFLVYKFLPNTSVRNINAAVGAVTAGSLWQITQWYYIKYQVGVAKYNAIYGGFSQIPILLFWLYISWVIVLLGAQIAHATQYYGQYLKELAAQNLSAHDKEKLTLLILLVLAKCMEERLPPESAERIARRFRAPVKLVKAILGVLCEMSVAAAVVDGERAPAYLPATPPDILRLDEVLDAVNACRGEDIAPAFENDYPFINDLHREFLDAPDLSGRTTLRDLYDRCGGELLVGK